MHVLEHARYFPFISEESFRGRKDMCVREQQVYKPTAVVSFLFERVHGATDIYADMAMCPAEPV